MKELVEHIREIEARVELRRGPKLVFLREARENAGVSQKVLAEVLGVNVSTLRRYENISMGPVGIDKAIGIARYLGLELEDITSREALEDCASQAEPAETATGRVEAVPTRISVEFTTRTASVEEDSESVPTSEASVPEAS